MRMPFLVWIAVAGLAASSTAEPTQAPASVVTPPWDLAAGFALVRMEPGPSLDRTALPGWNVAFATFPLGRFGLAVEVARNGRTPAVGDALVPDTKVRLGQTSFLAGPAVRVIRARRLTTSFRALLGVARVTTELPSDLVQDGIVPGQSPESLGLFEDGTVFAAAFGSNWDLRVSDSWAVRLNPSLLFTGLGDETQFTPRVTAGLVFRPGGGRER
jgi:hypothetical protein